MDALRDMFGSQAAGLAEALGGPGRSDDPFDETVARQQAETWLNRPITDEEWALLREFLRRARGSGG